VTGSPQQVDASTRRHELKTWPPYWQHIDDGTKPFELRRNDRDFKVGDVLWLREFNPSGYGYFTGRSCWRRVTYVLDPEQFIAVPDWVILGLAPIPPQEIAW